MSNVNGNNIDDLFKRASDQYPLRTDSADWSRLAADLEKDPSLILPPLSEEDGKRKRRRFFWLFLLLPLGGAGYYFWHSTQPHQQILVSTENNKAGGGENLHKEPAAKASLPKGTEGAVPGKSARTDQGYVEKATVGKAAGNSESNNGSSISKKNTGASGVTGTSEITGTSGGAGGSGTRGLSTEKGIAEESVGTVAVNTRQIKGKFIKVRSTRKRSVIVPSSPYEAPGSRLSVQRARTAEKWSLNVWVKNNRPAGPIHDSGTVRPTKINSRKGSFYAGVVVAPDLSLVKLQSVKGVGTTFGVLLGYRFNKKWAIESGVYVDRKKYYTDGQYFNLKTATIPVGSHLLDVNGVCNMLEIPLNIRYNLNVGPKMSWFATAGFSSYLMSNESYTYKYQYAPGGTTWDRAWMFKKPSQFWFSVLNMSVGYEQRLGKIGDLRLEPYLRVPLSGIGTGSLPIMSAGLNIGITRKFR